MDRRKSILNVSLSLTFKVFTMVLSIVVKRLLIQNCGNEVNGLNALYLSVIGFLAVAELGVGSAITFCMYKPIVEGNNQQVSALYQLISKLYVLIGGVILFGGLLVTPFIHHLAKDYAEIEVNLQLTFVLMLISVVISYLFSAKTSLFNAYKNNYVTTAITSGGIVLQYFLQIVVLLLTGSFTGYLMCRIVAVIAQWSITEIITRRKYRHIITNKQKVDNETKHTLVRSIKAMFMHKVGQLLVNTVDSIVISLFIGVVALGKYSNYIVILDSMTGVLKVAFSSLTSIVGHLFVRENKAMSKKYYEGFHLINFFIACVFFLGYYAIIDELIVLLFSADLVSERVVSFVIALNGFIQFMRTSTLVFRDATGVFYNDRWKPLVEGVVNIVLSVLLVKWIGTAGVIVATILTNLLICHVVEPYVLYKFAFGFSPRKYYRTNYSFIALFVVGMLAVQYFKVSNESVLMNLLVNGVISIGISTVICLVVMIDKRAQIVFMKDIICKRGRRHG